MSAPEVDHRAEAERLLVEAIEQRGTEEHHLLVSEAQVHATPAGPSVRTVGFVSRPPEHDSGLRDLLSAARVIIAQAAINVRENVVVIRPGDFQALIEQVNEATEAGL